jgi:hypothetical protein
MLPLGLLGFAFEIYYILKLLTVGQFFWPGVDLRLATWWWVKLTLTCEHVASKSIQVFGQLSSPHAWAPSTFILRMNKAQSPMPCHVFLKCRSRLILILLSVGGVDGSSNLKGVKRQRVATTPKPCVREQTQLSTLYFQIRYF